MRNWIIPTLCLLIFATISYFVGRSNSPSSSLSAHTSFTHIPSLTPYDVLWANDVKFWKLDLAGAGPHYGLSLVHINREGEEKEIGAIISSEVVDPKEKEVIVLISLKRDGNLLSGKYGYYSSSLSFKDREVFQNSSQGWNFYPVLNGDLYYLASDSDISGIGKEPYEPDSNRIALKLHRKPYP